MPPKQEPKISNKYSENFSNMDSEFYKPFLGRSPKGDSYVVCLACHTKSIKSNGILANNIFEHVKNGSHKTKLEAWGNLPEN